MLDSPTSKGPVATGEERDLWEPSSSLSLLIQFKAVASLRAPVKPVHADSCFAFFWMKNFALVLSLVLCLWLRFISFTELRSDFMTPRRCCNQFKNES